MARTFVCYAHPGATLEHKGAPCACFRGGPAPEFVAPAPRWSFRGILERVAPPAPAGELTRLDILERRAIGTRATA